MKHRSTSISRTEMVAQSIWRAFARVRHRSPCEQQLMISEGNEDCDKLSQFCYCSPRGSVLMRCNDAASLLKQPIWFIDVGRSGCHVARAEFCFTCLSSFDQPWTRRQNPCYPRPRCPRVRIAQGVLAPYSNAGRGSSAIFPYLFGTRCSCQRSPLGFSHPPMIPRVCLTGPSKECPLPSSKWYMPDLHMGRWRR